MYRDRILLRYAGVVSESLSLNIASSISFALSVISSEAELKYGQHDRLEAMYLLLTCVRVKNQGVVDKLHTFVTS